MTRPRSDNDSFDKRSSSQPPNIDQKVRIVLLAEALLPSSLPSENGLSFYEIIVDGNAGEGGKGDDGGPMMTTEIGAEVELAKESAVVEGNIPKTGKDLHWGGGGQ